MQQRLLKKEYFLSFVILSIACLVLFASQHPALSQDNDSEHFYYSDHKKIPLTPSSDHVAVRFKSGRKYHISKSFPSLVLPTKEKDLSKNRLVLFNLQKNLTNADVKKLKHDLRRDPNVELVTPVFKAPGASMIVTDEFIVQFAPNISENDIADLNNTYGVEIVKKVTWAENTGALCPLLCARKGECQYFTSVPYVPSPCYAGLSRRFPNVPSKRKVVEC